MKINVITRQEHGFDKGDRYDEDKANAWRSFYNTSPRDCASYILKAFRFLTKFVKDF